MSAIGWRRRLELAAAGALLATTLACSSSSSNRMSEPRKGATEKGIASWYGEPFHGRRTANGEVYDMNQVSAAHKSLPFDTHVRVENLDNGQSMVVRINDRGPFIKGRIIDLSLGAAREIDMVQAGVARVRLTVVDQPVVRVPDEAPPPKGYRIQVGAFLEQANAEALAEELERRYPGVEVSSDSRWHRVQIAGIGSSKKARRILEDLRREGRDAILVP